MSEERCSYTLVSGIGFGMMLAMAAEHSILRSTTIADPATRTWYSTIGVVIFGLSLIPTLAGMIWDIRLADRERREREARRCRSH